MTWRAFFPPAVVVLAAVACSKVGEVDSSESNVSGVAIGDVRGVVDISKTIRTRVLDPADPRTATFDVSRVAGSVFALRKQLGTFAVEGTTTTYQGGQPTPLRATLWHQIAGRFGAGIADLCERPGTTLTFVAYQSDFDNGGDDGTDPVGDSGVSERGVFAARSSFAKTVAEVCAYEGDEAARKAAASKLFDSVMGIGGSLAEERIAFAERFAGEGSAAVKAAPKDRVRNMMTALFLNPHFLLAK